MRYARPIGLFALFVLALLFPFWSDAATTSVVFFILIFAVIAVAWNLFSGYTGYISLGHMVYYALGAYTLAIVCQTLHIPGGTGPLLLLPLAGCVACGCAVPLGWIALRTRRHTFMVITIAIFFMFQVLAYNLPLSNGSAGVFLPVAPWGAETFDLPFYYAALVALLGAVFASWWIRRSKFGLSLLAIRDDEHRARGLGIKTGAFKLAVYVLSAFFLGLAGALSAYFVGVISPLTFFDPTSNVVVIAVVYLGGVGTLVGPLVGALLLVPLQQFLTMQLGATPGLNLVVYGCLLLVVILVLPEGILPALQGRWTAALKPLLAVPWGLVSALCEKGSLRIAALKPASAPLFTRAADQQQSVHVTQEEVQHTLASAASRGADTVTLRFDPGEAASLTLNVDPLRGEIIVTVEAHPREEAQALAQSFHDQPHPDQSYWPGSSTRLHASSPASMRPQQPGNVTEQLAHIFAAVLEIPVGSVTSGTNFFASGGDALALTALLKAIERQFRHTLRPEDVFGHAELAQLARLLLPDRQGTSVSTQLYGCTSRAAHE